MPELNPPFAGSPAGSSAALRRDDPVPLHSRIREDLRERIVSGAWPAHRRMPSEAELMQHYGVSRITVRQALQALEHQGLILKVPGKGSFVAPAKPYQELSRLQGLAEAMTRQGHAILNQVLLIERQSATPALAQALSLREGEPLTHLKRLRLLDGQPVSLDLTWLPRAIGDQVAAADLAQRDVFLIEDLGLRLGHADLAIDTLPADPELARLLRVEPGSPVLRIERLTHTDQGQPIDHERLYCRTDNFQYRLRIERRQEP